MACIQSVKSVPLEKVTNIRPHELAQHLHSSQPYMLLDCRPVLAYNTCHISGAVNVNFTGMMKKRFIAGKIGLADLVTTEEGRERFKTWTQQPTVVYDEDTSDVTTITSQHSLGLVISALASMDRPLFLLEGGLNEFGPLHPSLCEISIPRPMPRGQLPPPPRATTPGMRDQGLDWQTAPPVHVLNFLVLGSEKDAKSIEVFELFKIQRVLNVTPSCPNHFEKKGVLYRRISVSDTGTQKLSNRFSECFEFIDEARKKNNVLLIHCMAGISRSVTVTIAYLMSRFRMPMQRAYQFVKDKRPAISPNLNFMGQLVEFERELELRLPTDKSLDLGSYLPSAGQQSYSRAIMDLHRSHSNTSLGSATIPESPETPFSADGGGAASNEPFVLKPLNPKDRRTKKLRRSLHGHKEECSSDLKQSCTSPESAQSPAKSLEEQDKQFGFSSAPPLDRLRISGEKINLQTKQPALLQSRSSEKLKSSWSPEKMDVQSEQLSSTATALQKEGPGESSFPSAVHDH